MGLHKLGQVTKKLVTKDKLQTHIMTMRTSERPQWIERCSIVAVKSLS
jgi:hypothetical protein